MSDLLAQEEIKFLARSRNRTGKTERCPANSCRALLAGDAKALVARPHPHGTWLFPPHQGGGQNG
jgi:hypothetical protein